MVLGRIVGAKSPFFKKKQQKTVKRKLTFTLWIIGSHGGFYMEEGNLPASMAVMTKMDKACWKGGCWKAGSEAVVQVMDRAELKFIHSTDLLITI